MSSIEQIKLQAKINSLEQFILYKFGSNSSDMQFLNDTYNNEYNRLIENIPILNRPKKIDLKLCRSTNHENRELYYYIIADMNKLGDIHDFTSKSIINNGDNSFYISFGNGISKLVKHGDYILRSVKCDYIKIIDGGLFHEHFKEFE